MKIDHRKIIASVLLITAVLAVFPGEVSAQDFGGQVSPENPGEQTYQTFPVEAREEGEPPAWQEAPSSATEVPEEEPLAPTRMNWILMAGGLVLMIAPWAWYIIKHRKSPGEDGGR